MRITKPDEVYFRDYKSRVSLEKNFSVKSFLGNFSISNKSRRKKLIISRFSVLINEKLIELTLRRIDKNGSFSLLMGNQLTPLLIKKSEEIYFYTRVIKK